MSDHYRIGRRDTDYRPHLLDPGWVTRHDCSPRDMMERHNRQARAVLKRGKAALNRIAPHLMLRIAHDKTLRVAWDHLKSYGGQAPGPDGLRYDDLSESETWDYLRGLRDEIRDGTYRPDEERICHIPKGPGRGTRPLVIQCIADRVVQRAVVEIVQPFLNPLFDEFSFGFRPRRCPLHAIATAEWMYMEQGRRVWVTADLRDAFLRVPLHRLLDVMSKYLVAEDLVQFIGRVLGGATTPGLRQGGPLSPILLNLYLHHVLDRKWRRMHPDIPLIRYADDILLTCRTVAEGSEAHKSLKELLRPAGMLLKEDSGVWRLSTEPVDWMGFRIQWSRAQLTNGRKTDIAINLTEQAWWRLGDSLACAHDEPDSPLRAIQRIKGWVGQRGPCYRSSHIEAAVDRVVAMAREQAFDEIPSCHRLLKFWQTAYARWEWLRAKWHDRVRQYVGTDA